LLFEKEMLEREVYDHELGQISVMGYFMVTKYVSNPA
jgi:hypothetical protein